MRDGKADTVVEQFDMLTGLLGPVSYTHLFVVEFEDGRHPSTLQDFIKAMEFAKLKELQDFFKSKSLFFEDGYIKVIKR